MPGVELTVGTPLITTYKNISLTSRTASDARAHISAEKPDGA